MNPAFDQNIDINVVMPTLGEMLAVPSQQVFTEPTPIYDARYDTFLPDAPDYGAHHQELPGPITPESSIHHLDQYDNVSYAASYEQGEVLTQNNRVEEEETDGTLSEWRDLVEFNIPDYAQVPAASIP
jgi:hypothetical protein